jgi:hypothetical protein
MKGSPIMAGCHDWGSLHARGIRETRRPPRQDPDGTIRKSRMNNPSNPFEAPGERELQNMGGARPSPPPEIFKRPTPGAGARRNAAPSQEPSPELVEDFPVQEDIPSEEARPEDGAQLRNPAWSLEEGVFNEKVTVSVEGTPPKEKPHLTRVVFTLFALSSEGSRERVDSKETHLKDERASLEFTLYYPTFREDGGLPATCKYVFMVKHKESKELESDFLTVEAAPPLPVYDPGKSEDAEAGCFSSYEPPDTESPVV